MQDVDASVRHALRARLRELVATRPPGSRLPSERELAVRWGVARMTVRHAMDDLATEGLVTRRHGSGTYVAQQPFARLLGLTSFTQDMRERGLVPSSRLLSFETVSADPALASSLQVGIGVPVVRFTRLRLGSDEPMAVETVAIPAALAPDLEPTDLDGSLYELLVRRYGIVTGSADVTILPVVPDPATRDLLQLSTDQACLRLRMVDADTHGRVVMFADCVYRGDRYQLSAHLAGSAFSSQARRAG